MNDKVRDLIIDEIKENRKEIKKIYLRFSKYDVKLAVLAILMLVLAGEKLGLAKLIF